MNKAEFLSDLENNLKIINNKIKEGLSVNKIAPEFFGCREDNIRKWLKEVNIIRDKKSRLFVKQSEIAVVGGITTENYESVIQNNKDSYSTVIDFNKATYNDKNKLKKKGNKMKIELKDFKDLSVEEKVRIINEKAAGKKTLSQISKEDFDFSVSSHMNQYHKNNVTWDGAIKCYKLINKEPQKENIFNEEDIEILKAFIERQKVIKQINEMDDKGIDKVFSVRLYQNIYKEFKAKVETDNSRIQDVLGSLMLDYINNK